MQHKGCISTRGLCGARYNYRSERDDPRPRAKHLGKCGKSPDKGQSKLSRVGWDDELLASLNIGGHWWTRRGHVRGEDDEGRAL